MALQQFHPRGKLKLLGEVLADRLQRVRLGIRADPVRGRLRPRGAGAASLAGGSRQPLHLRLQIGCANLRGKIAPGHGLDARRALGHRLECRGVVPVGKMQLGLPARPAVGGPAKLGAVRREHRQPVKARGPGHADRFVQSVGVRQEELEVVEAQLVGGEDEILSGGMKVRGPGHAPEVGDATHIRAVHAAGVHVGVHSARVEAAPDDPLAVRREERAAVIARGAGDLADV